MGRRIKHLPGWQEVHLYNCQDGRRKKRKKIAPFSLLPPQNMLVLSVKEIQPERCNMILTYAVLAVAALVALVVTDSCLYNADTRTESQRLYRGAKPLAYYILYPLHMGK
jgi:hypothetical protein